MKTLKEIISSDPLTSYSRVEALRGLIQLARTDDDLLNYVLGLKNDQSLPFRLKWARHLSRIKSEKVAQAFIECLETEEHNHVIKFMIKGLAQSADKSFVQLIKPFLEHESHAIQHAAKMTIAELEYEPVIVKAEKVEKASQEQLEVKKPFPKHQLPWRLKLKFFYRKYKFVLYLFLALSALYPISLGIGKTIESIKELIVSYQPTAEEIAEKKRLEEERLKKLEELKRLEEQQRLEDELAKQLEEERRLKEHKPVNWGKYLASLLIVIVLGALVYGLSKVLTILDYKELDHVRGLATGTTSLDKGDSKIGGGSKADSKDLSKIKTRRPGRYVQKEHEISKPRKDVENAKFQKAEKFYHNKIVSQAKVILFSFFDRFFRLFNFKDSKSVLKIFIPNDLFYWIRFRSMLSCLQTLISWGLMTSIAFCVYMYFSGSLSQQNYLLLIQPLIKPGIPVILCIIFFGFFLANPFKLSGINLYKIMSDYYYKRKYYFRVGEQEQWAILLRNIRDSSVSKTFSWRVFIIQRFLIIGGLVLFTFFIYIPLLNRFQTNKAFDVFNFGQIKEHIAGFNWGVFDLVLASILVLPCLGFVISSLIRPFKEKVKSDTTGELREEDESSQRQRLEGVYKNLLSAESIGSKEEPFKVLCGEEKEQWLREVLVVFKESFPDFKISIEFLSDDKAIKSAKVDIEYDVWLPDSSLKANKAFPSKFKDQEKSLKNLGCILRTPLVYVFRKSVLKDFLESYVSVNYRSLTDARGKLRNMAGRKFDFAHPDYGDYSIGTASLILMTNEYFRTTVGPSREELKNKIFQRSIQEYLSGLSISDRQFESDAFITTEKRAIDSLSSSKKRFWTTVYPRMTLYMEHPFLLMRHSEKAVFLFGYLASLGVQKRVEDFGWRAGNTSNHIHSSDTLKNWEEINIQKDLGVCTRLPELAEVKKVIEIAKQTLV